MKAVEYFASLEQLLNYHSHRHAKVAKAQVVWDLLDGNPALKNTDLTNALTGRGFPQDLPLYGEIRRTQERLNGTYRKDFLTDKRLSPKDVQHILNRDPSRSTALVSTPKGDDQLEDKAAPKGTNGTSSRSDLPPVFPLPPLDTTGEDDLVWVRTSLVPTLIRAMKKRGWTAVTINSDGDTTWEKVVVETGVL